MSHRRKVKVSQAAGMRYTGEIVEEEWFCRWQKISAENDDGIDGLILYERKSKVTDAIFVQVKGGKGYRAKTSNYPEHICLNLGTKYISSHREKWNSYPGPVILVYVEPKSGRKSQDKAWWTDLKSETSYTAKAKSYILVPKEQKFDETAKKKIYSLTEHRYQESTLPNIETGNNILSHISLNKDSIKKSAKTYYNNLNKIKLSPACEEFTDILFTRVGWKHITRKTRSLQRIIQSLILLPVAKELIEKIKRYHIVDYSFVDDGSGGGVLYQTLLIRGRVSFSFRYPAIVNIILRRKIRISSKGKHLESKVWFYSVYESRRKKELVR
ncbi:DUF4365 domain-containing protein [Neobacillus mesonae]|uniref:DUF4365 domain-containing protein n=1 Tax=Neobacillus mesonae TaxID=1193713 RepID=UPI002573451B|nr:DUF4365 domain-containing protein [Neobacillus mesonae]